MVRPASMLGPAAPEPVRLLGGLYAASLAAVDPLIAVPPALPAPPRGRTVVVGVGKAAAAMALAVERNWQGALSGVVVVPPGAALPLQRIRVLEGSHPLPDERSVAAGRALLQAVEGLGSDDLVLALVSGGGSALCAVPGDWTSLEEKRAISKALMHGGADIRELNTVRRHLSAIKGGRLAQRAAPAPVVSIMISDIPGDDPTFIASGPTLPDPTCCAEVLEILRRYQVAPAEPLRRALESGAAESPKPDDEGFRRNRHQLVASAQMALDAAAREAAARGWAVHLLSDAFEGEARHLAINHAALVRQVRSRHQPFNPPCILLSGGEATVTVHGKGRGGRNTEFALAFALASEGMAGVYCLSAGTDGLDGSAAAAGAWTAPDTLAAARAKGLEPGRMLRDNDSFSLFEAVGAAVVTGPTHTNVNDFRAILIEAE